METKLIQIDNVKAQKEALHAAAAEVRRSFHKAVVDVGKRAVHVNNDQWEQFQRLYQQYSAEAVNRYVRAVQKTSVDKSAAIKRFY